MTERVVVWTRCAKPYLPHDVPTPLARAAGRGSRPLCPAIRVIDVYATVLSNGVVLQ